MDALADILTGSHRSAARRTVIWARVLALACIAIGIAVMAGWYLDEPRLKQVMRFSPTMKPDSAAALMVSGLALVLYTFERLRRAAAVLGAVLVVFGVISLTQDFTGFAIRIDQLLFKKLAEAPYFTGLGRVAMIAALSFILFGASIITAQLRWRHSFILTQCILALVFITALIVVVAHGYGARELFYTYPATAMAVHLGVGFMLLSAGMLMARPERGITKTVIDPTTSGLVIRRLAPGIVLVPLMIGWLRQSGERAGLYESALGTAVLTVTMIVALAGLSWMTAAALRRADQERQKVLHDLHGQREWLRTSLESIGDAVIAIDDKGAVLVMNPIAEKLTGWTFEEASGRPVWEIYRVLDETTREATEDAAIKAMRDRKANSNPSLILCSRDNREIPVEDKGAPIMDASGEVVGGAIVIFRDISHRRREEEQRDLMINELNHRVRNVLMVVHSLVQQVSQETTSKPKKEMAGMLADRLRSLSRAHELLLENHWRGASLKIMVERELEAFNREASDRITISGADLLLPQQYTSIISMTVHELATNAAKYGALAQKSGLLRVSWTLKNDKLRFTWTESGVKLTKASKSGFGTRLIERGITRNLGGESKVSYNDDGLKVQITLPFDSDIQAQH